MPSRETHGLASPCADSTATLPANGHPVRVIRGGGVHPDRTTLRNARSAGVPSWFLGPDWKETRMAGDPHLVMAFFPSEQAADGSADALKAWAKTNARADIEAIGR